MVKVAHNYGNKIVCPICTSKEDDTQEHLFKCLTVKLNNSQVFHMQGVKYEDIYSTSLEKLINIARICESAARTRERLSA